MGSIILGAILALTPNIFITALMYIIGGMLILGAINQYMNLVNAINFIDLTKLEGQPTEERVVPQLTEGEKKTRKNRITIKALLWTIAVVDTALIVYVLYAIMQLLF